MRNHLAFRSSGKNHVMPSLLFGGVGLLAALAACSSAPPEQTETSSSGLTVGEQTDTSSPKLNVNWSAGRAARVTAGACSFEPLADSGSSCCGNPTLLYGGGEVVHNAKFHLINWVGSPATTSPLPNASILQSFLSDVLELPIASVLSEYPDSSGSLKSVAFAGTHNLTTAIPGGTTTNPLTQAQIESAIDQDPANTSTAFDDIYVMIVPSGIQACANSTTCTFATPGGNGTIGAWHRRTPGGRTYAVVFGNNSISVNPNDPVTDGYIFVLSHELFEAFTDSTNGWRAGSSNTSGCGGSEIGDLCGDKSSLFTVYDTAYGGPLTFSVQSEWSNKAQACVDQLPTISSVTPNSGPAGQDTGVTIKGTNFVPGQTTFAYVTGTTASNCSTTSCGGTVSHLAAGDTTLTDQVHLQATVAWANGATTTTPPSSNDEFTFIGTGPACSLSGWSCYDDQPSAEFSCSPPPLPSPPFSWVLEREVGGTFQQVNPTVTTDPVTSIATIVDVGYSQSPTTYRVCYDVYGALTCATYTLSGAAPSAASCACQPTTCQAQNACNTQIFDGCSTWLSCGGCASGESCVSGQCKVNCPTGESICPATNTCLTAAMCQKVSGGGGNCKPGTCS